MKVLVLGTVTLNGGDAAINRAQRVILQRQWPDLEIVCSDTQPEAAARYSTDETFVPALFETFVAQRLTRVPGRPGWLRPFVSRRWQARALTAARRYASGRSVSASLSEEERSALDLLRSCDLVVYCGGTSLTPNYHLNRKLFDIELAVAMGKPLAFMQQSAGPFKEKSVRRRLARLATAAAVVILRDERSRGHLAELGVPADRLTVLPDTVFAMAPERRPSRPGDDRSLRVAVSVREWKHFTSLPAAEGMARFVEAVRVAVTHLVRDRQAEVEFVSTCQGRPEYWIDDSALAVDIAEGLPAEVAAHVRVDRSARSPEELLAHLGGFDAMVSTRLHGAILAVCAGVPTLAVAYEYKTAEVWSQLGLESFFEDIEDLADDSLAVAVGRLLDRHDEVSATLAREVPRLRAGALEAGELIAQATGLTAVAAPEREAPAGRV